MARWERFYTEWKNGWLQYKQHMEITIYGSYKPDAQKRLLIRLKDALIQEGYTSTRLVEDFPNPKNLSSFELSKACLEYSDVNFLVFTFAGKRFGVSRELAHCCSPSMIDRRWRCVSFEQRKANRTALPPMNSKELESLHISNISRVEFGDQRQLRNAMLGMATEYLFDLAETLRQRSR